MLARKPIFWIFAVAVFLGALGLVVQQVVLRSYETLEQQAIEQSTEQVVKALQAEVRQIAIVGNDYASWDEMYDFVRDQNPKFHELNFSELGLREMEIDVVMLVNEAGEEVFSAEQNPGAQTYSLPASQNVRTAVSKNLKNMLRERPPEAGLRLLDLNAGSALFSAHPIIRTDRTGPQRGHLIFVRVLRPSTIARMEMVSQLPVGVWRVNDKPPTGLPSQIIAWARNSPFSTDRTALTLSGDDIAGYARLRNLDGSSALILSTVTPRAVYQQGRRTAIYLFACIAALVIFTLITAFVLGRRNQRSESLARANETLYRAVVEQADEGIALLAPESHAILQSNPALARLTGYSTTALHDSSVESIIENSSLPLLWNILSAPKQVGGVPCELRLRRIDGALIEVDITANPLTIDGRQLICLMVRDVSQRKQAEAKLLDHQRRLEHLANHDSLTDLPNRLLLNQKLPGILERAAASQSSVAVCYIDVDNFKNINDSSGHDTGDEFLRAIAERLRHVVSSEDLVARISGDEFVVVSMAKEAIVFDAIARRITSHLRAPLVFSGREYSVSVSMGVAVYPTDGSDAADLLRSADIALYRAKERGRDNYQFFAPEMNDRVHQRMQLEQALRVALQEQQISVHYQPVMDLRSQKIAALEALARWRHPELGDIPPSQFIPIAEESGLIVELGEAVLRQVCHQISTWSHAGLPVVPVSVNVSAQQLQRTNIRERVLAICSEAGINPRLLQVELTESTVMREIDRQIGALEGLRAAGVRISIDDFGTGYSSLSYLKHLPIDHLKIDRSFVRDMTVDANDAAIVSAIISMARSLRLETIAEGVETRQHAMRLASLGCGYAQGYLYSRPVPAAECAKLLVSMGTIPNPVDTGKHQRLIASK